MTFDLVAGDTAAERWANLASQPLPPWYERRDDPLELNEAEYRQLAGMAEVDRNYWLPQLIHAQDYNRRRIIGIYASLTPGASVEWNDRWHKDIAHHEARAREGYALAECRWSAKGQK